MVLLVVKLSSSQELYLARNKHAYFLMISELNFPVMKGLTIRLTVIHKFHLEKLKSVQAR